MLGYFLMPHPPIIIPEVGKGREEEVIKTVNSCKLIGEKVKDLDVETIIIVTPHGPMFRDAVAIFSPSEISGNLGRFGAPEVKFNYKIDNDLTSTIIRLSNENNITVADIDEETSKLYKVSLELDHGAMVPLYYVGREKKYKVVYITYGMLSPMELMKFGTCIKKAVKDTKRKVIFIASGDLSHRLTEDGPYPYSPLGHKFDKNLIDTLQSGEVKNIFTFDKELIKEAGECGLRSLYVLSGVLNSSKIQGELLSYEGPLGVGYGVMEFKEGKGNLYNEFILEKEQEHKRRMEEGNSYTKLARKNLDRYFNKGTLIDVEEIDDEVLLHDRKGVFVSLKIKGELRGCIGTISPTTNSVGEEIIRNSLSAALTDPRFSPVKKPELLEIDISVDLLYPSEVTTFEELDPKNYGVIVNCGNRRGLLLPSIEGVDTKEEQVSIALQKGGISPNEKYTLERFKVERFKEDEDDE